MNKTATASTDPQNVDVLRYTAFPDVGLQDPDSGGNPAGVVLNAAGLADDARLAIACATSARSAR